MNRNHISFLTNYGSEDHLDEILNGPFATPHIRVLATKNKNLSQKHIDSLVSDTFTAVRRGIASHPNLSDKNKKDLLNDKDWYVREIIGRRLARENQQ